MTPRALSLLLLAPLLSACGADAAQRIDAPAPGAAIKFYNVALNAPGVNFYANDATKLTAVIPPSGLTVDTTGTRYSFLGNGGLYSGMTPGQYTFSAKPASPADSARKVGSAPATLADGKYYSFFLSGFYDATTKVADAFVLQDDFPTTIDFGVTNIRFVNASPNAQPLQLDLMAAGTTQVLATSQAVPYKSGSTFLTIPPAFYDLSAHYVGSSTKLFTRTGVSFTGGRVWTITARGDVTVTSATATNRPFLDNTANR